MPKKLLERLLEWGDRHGFGTGVTVIVVVGIPMALWALRTIPENQTRKLKDQVHTLATAEAKVARVKTEVDNVRAKITAQNAQLSRTDKKSEEERQILARLRASEMELQNAINQQADAEADLAIISRVQRNQAEVASAENEARRTLVQILGGIFFFTATIFTWRTVIVSERNLRATQDKQIAERFVKATESLASEKLAVRLGGIYSLERLAKDSITDHDTVLEVLTAFIRERCSLSVSNYDRPVAKVADKDATVIVDDGDSSNSTGNLLDNLDGEDIQTDLQAVLTVLGRRQKREGERAIDLSNTTLNGVKLSDADLSDAKLSGTTLIKADLSDAKLNNVNLSHANLSGAELIRAKLSRGMLIKANLSNADLRGADLSNANLRWANLSGINLRRGVLRGANLSDTDLRGAKLINANLIDTDLSDADLSDANLRGADLRGGDLSWAKLIRGDLVGVKLIKADLSDADLNDADLSGTDLSDADLRGAKLTNATLTEAKLINTNFHGADLSNAKLKRVDLSQAINLTQEQIASARIDKGTKLPPGLTLPNEEGQASE